MRSGFMQRSRVLAAILGLGFATAMVLAPGSLYSQEEEPCMFDDGTDEWACTEGPHMYEGQCEGIDCYSSMEFCCIIVE